MEYILQYKIKRLTFLKTIVKYWIPYYDISMIELYTLEIMKLRKEIDEIRGYNNKRISLI